MSPFNQIVLVAAALLQAHAALAQVPQDADKAAMERCLNDPERAATSGQTDCIDRARRSYDARLNAAYGALMHLTQSQARAALRRSQRNWVAHRDLEAAARSAIYGGLQGTLNVPAEAYDEMVVTRDRALLLEGYLRAVQSSAPRE